VNTDFSYREDEKIQQQTARTCWLIAVLPLTCALSCVNHEIVREPDCLSDPLTIQLDRPVQHATCDIPGGFFVRIARSDHSYSLLLNGAPQELEIDPLDPLAAFHPLSSGDYLVELVDVRGCSDTLHVRIRHLSSHLAVSVLTTADDKCEEGNGLAMISVSGAQGFCDIYLDNQLLLRERTTASIEVRNLEAGVHNIQVVDSSMCSYQAAVTIPRGLTGISWSRDVQPIVKTYCARAGCHVPETGRVDFTSFDNVRFYSSQIRTRILNRSMPFDGPLPGNYISTIVCWIDDGAQAN